MSETFLNRTANNYHKDGFNCAESIFLAFRERVAPDFPAEAVRMATPFGGGLGYAGCLCGALTGAVMILGVLKGREKPEVPRKEPYALSKEFHNRFKEKFGATCCRVLNREIYGSPERGVTCSAIINGTEELLSEFIEEKKLFSNY